MASQYIPITPTFVIDDINRLISIIYFHNPLFSNPTNFSLTNFVDENNPNSTFKHTQSLNVPLGAHIRDSLTSQHPEET